MSNTHQNKLPQRLFFTSQRKVFFILLLECRTEKTQRLIAFCKSDAFSKLINFLNSCHSWAVCCRFVLHVMIWTGLLHYETGRRKFYFNRVPLAPCWLMHVLHKFLFLLFLSLKFCYFERISRMIKLNYTTFLRWIIHLTKEKLHFCSSSPNSRKKCEKFSPPEKLISKKL